MAGASFAKGQAEREVVNQTQKPFVVAIDSPKLVLESGEEGDCFEVENLVVADNFGSVENLPTFGLVKFGSNLREGVGGFDDVLGDGFLVEVLRLVGTKGTGTGLDTFFNFVAPALRHSPTIGDRLDAAKFFATSKSEERGIGGCDVGGPLRRDVDEKQRQDVRDGAEFFAHGGPKALGHCAAAVCKGITVVQECKCFPPDKAGPGDMSKQNSDKLGAGSAALQHNLNGSTKAAPSLLFDTEVPATGKFQTNEFPRGVATGELVHGQSKLVPEGFTDSVARLNDQLFVGPKDGKVVHIPGCEKVLSIAKVGAGVAVNDVLVIGKTGFLHRMHEGGLAKVQSPVPPHGQHAKLWEDEIIARHSRAVDREKVEVFRLDARECEELAECLRDSNIVKGTLNVPRGQVVGFRTTFNTGERTGGR